MKHITKRLAVKLMGDHAHEIDYALKDCDIQGWKSTNWQLSSLRCTIYAKKFNQRWRFGVIWD